MYIHTLSFLPHANILPSEDNATEWLSPAATLIILSRSSTFVGVKILSFEPHAGP